MEHSIAQLEALVETPLHEAHERSSKADKGAEAWREEVQAQLDRLLASRYFSNSRRCHDMLHFIVQSSLTGQSGSLKERNLGIEVFHRAVDYDTNADPIVRLSAGEIRKRLAQYYCEPEHERELRIALPTGSYTVEFHRHQPAPEVVDEAPVAVSEAEMPAVRIRLRHYQWMLMGICGVLVCAVLALLLYTHWPTPGLRLWSGVLQQRNPVLICIGQPDHAMSQEEYNKMASTLALGDRLVRLDTASINDVDAVTQLAGVLGSQGIHYSVRGAASTTFTELQQGPAILVSGIDNTWTMRATRDLRFHFNGKFEGTRLFVWIEDRNNPANHNWQVDFSQPYQTLARDYALVGRYYLPETGHPVLLAAGIGANGTQAAAGCLTSRSCMKAILDRDPAHGRKNIEAVLGTDVIENRTGLPDVLAVHSW